MGCSPRIASIVSRSCQNANPARRIPTNRSPPCPGCSACSGSSPSIRTRPDRDLPQMRRQAQGDRLHRGSQRDRHHPCAHSTTRGGRTVTAARATPALGAPRHPKPAQAVLERRLTLVCGLDVGDAPIRASFRAFPFPGTQSAAPPGDRLKPSLSGVLRRPHHSGGYSSYARWST